MSVLLEIERACLSLFQQWRRDGKRRAGVPHLFEHIRLRFALAEEISNRTFKKKRA